jgi:ribosome maturation factor RimP
MKAPEIIEQVKATIEPDLDARELEVVDMEFRREPIGMVLRVFVDHPAGVTLETCAEASELISGILDKTDIIKSSYTLEVSSPGVERRLTKPGHYQRFLGRAVKVTAKKAVDGKKRFTGKLVRADESGFSIEIDGELIDFMYEQVTRVNLVFTEW